MIPYCLFTIALIRETSSVFSNEKQVARWRWSSRIEVSVVRAFVERRREVWFLISLIIQYRDSPTRSKGILGYFSESSRSQRLFIQTSSLSEVLLAHPSLVSFQCLFAPNSDKKRIENMRTLFPCSLSVFTSLQVSLERLSSAVFPFYGRYLINRVFLRIKLPLETVNNSLHRVELWLMLTDDCLESVLFVYPVTFRRCSLRDWRSINRTETRSCCGRDLWHRWRR